MIVSRKFPRPFVVRLSHARLARLFRLCRCHGQIKLRLRGWWGNGEMGPRLGRVVRKAGNSANVKDAARSFKLVRSY